jgi:hypothetical protein
VIGVGNYNNSISATTREITVGPSPDFSKPRCIGAANQR